MTTHIKDIDTALESMRDDMVSSNDILGHVYDIMNRDERVALMVYLIKLAHFVAKSTPDDIKSAGEEFAEFWATDGDELRKECEK